MQTEWAAKGAPFGLKRFANPENAVKAGECWWFRPMNLHTVYDYRHVCQRLERGKYGEIWNEKPWTV